MPALQPWPLKILADSAFGDAALPTPVRALIEFAAPGQMAVVAFAALASVALAALTLALDAALVWTWATAGQRMLRGLQADLFDRLQRRSLLQHVCEPVGEPLTRLFGDAWCVQTALHASVCLPAQNALTLAAIGAVAWRLDPELCLLSLALAPPLAAAGLVFGRRLDAQSRDERAAQARLTSLVQQVLSAVPLIQAFAAERRHALDFRREAADMVRLSRSAALTADLHAFAAGTISTLGLAAVVFVGGQRVLSGALSVGTLLLFLAYLRSAQGAVQGLLGAHVEIRRTRAKLERVTALLDAAPGVWQAPNARPLRRPAGGLRFEDVSFGYAAGRPVLHQVSLAVAAGETVVLVGRSGSGKTTLASLVPRFFEPWEGRVLIGDADVRSLTLDSLRRHVGLVLQEPFLLPLTVADTIAYGRPEASRREIEAAADAADAHDFIRALPQGYDTVLGERGATLSGGQRQRLAIARALLKDAPILILDEPTAALDRAAESAVLDTLDCLKAGRTTLVIAHRLSTVRGADRVVVLDRGRIVESGPEARLLARRGAYHRLHRLQQAEPARRPAS